MSLLPPSLSLLLALLWEASPIPAEASQALWYRGLVSQAQLDAATTYVSFQVSDEILCSALASKAAWCHLLTYDGATCALYDVDGGSFSHSSPTAVTTCDGDFVQDALGCVYLHKVPWSRLQISKIYELSWTRTRRARVSS
ncbi:hypothetical protein E2C01_013126 [Portunus trituberculatus]|uniref:Apple domain-containing protein n=1 Tax=Portunus trituberculatus TaxID=210409 RepID=A0A5B7DG66_PORTR|nr:hypothetical protein [Portunus trituberculatus]